MYILQYLGFANFIRLEHLSASGVLHQFNEIAQLSIQIYVSRLNPKGFNPLDLRPLDRSTWTTCVDVVRGYKAVILIDRVETQPDLLR